MRRRSLLTQVLVANLMLISIATVAAAMVANPDLSLNDPGAGLVLGFALALTVLVNLFMLARRFRPLEELIAEMERADLSRPASAATGATAGIGSAEEVSRLEVAFRRMLERLEAERRRAAGASLEGQERERERVARDLHDEVNQSLTGLLLRLEAARAKAPRELEAELAETKTLANQAMEELLALARQLRPTALDDLGLKAALAGHLEELSRQSGIETSFEADGDLAGLPNDVQLVLYRVAQEAISNASRHGGPTAIRVRVRREDGRVDLQIADDGRGFAPAEVEPGLGIPGMLERALLVGGELTVESVPSLGTGVRLAVPLVATNPVLPAVAVGGPVG